MKFTRLIMAFTAAALLVGTVAPKAEAAPDYVFKVGYENHPGSILDQGAKKWAEIVDKKSNGKIKLELYPSSQLGTKQEIIEQALLGMPVCVIGDAGFLGEYVPDITIVSGPYFADWDKLFKLFKTDWFKGLEAQLREKGIEIISYNWMYGYRHLVANKAVKTPADLKGLKIRVPGAPIQIEAFKAMGATPTPMPLGEVYPALTQKVIDGAENPLNVLYEQKLHEPTKNLSLIGYLTMATAWIGGSKWFESVPPEVAKIIKDASDEAGEYSKQIVPAEDQKIIDKMKAEGVTIIEVDPAPFREAAKDTYNKFPEWTPGLYEKVQKIMADMK